MAMGGAVKARRMRRALLRHRVASLASLALTVLGCLTLAMCGTVYLAARNVARTDSQRGNWDRRDVRPMAQGASPCATLAVRASRYASTVLWPRVLRPHPPP